MLALSALGCSFVAVPSPPSDPVERSREAANACTTSVFYPVMDSVGAAAGGISMAVAAADDRGKVIWYSAEMEAETALLLSGVQLALFGAGATYGYIQTGRCRALNEEVEAAEKRGETPGVVGETGWKKPPPGKPGVPRGSMDGHDPAHEEH